MDFEIRVTPAALADLENVAAWSWTKHPATTLRFVRDLLNHVELLKSFPYMGASVRGYPGVRRILLSPLHVYYRIHDDRLIVEVIHFWHGSRRDPIL